MSLAELERAVASKKRIQMNKAREQANFDYILADLIGRSISRVYNSANTMPDIATVYPNLFNAKEIEEKKRIKQDELSALRFKQFANSYNARFKGVQMDNE